ncbi:MAG: hypothetical protein V1846_01740 [Candidatus Komeilibacteria bacterium]
MILFVILGVLCAICSGYFLDCKEYGAALTFALFSLACLIGLATSQIVEAIKAQKK